VTPGTVPPPTARLICGDAVEVMRTLPDECVDAVVTDPPYGMGTTTTTRRSVDQVIVRKTYEWDVWTTDWVAEAARVLRPDGAFVAFCPELRTEALHEAIESSGLQWRQVWYWYKTNPIPSVRGLLQWAVEPIVYATKGKPRLRIRNAGDAHNVFRFPHPAISGDHPDHTGHPNQKSLALMRHILRLVADPGATILDCFVGSGTTLVAAAVEGMHGIGIDLNPDYIHMAERRVAPWVAQTRLFQGVTG